ncbi:hypothetical protein FRB90_000948 [Tulasnella sp. 427]|nr:hypothetical protein FRB90_000948 [Tulasnella sp. 427]
MSRINSSLNDDISTIDLEVYASEAVLPNMTYRNHSQRPTKPRSPNIQRKLKFVHRITNDEFFERVKSYSKARPPSRFSRSSKDYSLRVPNPNHSAVQAAGVLNDPDNEAGIQSWVEQVALQTALCLLHSAEPDHLGLELARVSGEGTRQICSDFGFRMDDSRNRWRTNGGYKLAVEVKCPWTLSRSDMVGISNLRNGLSLVAGETKYSTSQSVLAQVYDYCFNQDHCFWIITTYEYWVFGVFSKDYELALVTEPISFDNASPTVLQCIVYWLQSSVFRAGAFEPPKMTGFNIPCSRSVWKETLRLWREGGIKEIESRFAVVDFDDPDGLLAECISSVDGRNFSVTYPTDSWYAEDSLEPYRSALRLLGRSSTILQWRVLLIWLALLADPLTTSPGLSCLERAFRASSRSSHSLQRQESSWASRNAIQPTLWVIIGPTIAPEPGATLWERPEIYASAEVTFILNNYLPSPIREELNEIFARVSQGSTSSRTRPESLDTPERPENGVRTISGSTSRARSSTERSNAPRPIESPGLNNQPTPESASTASLQRSKTVSPHYPFHLLRSDSDSVLDSPATPTTPSSNRHRPPFASSSSDLTPAASRSGPLAEAGNDSDERIDSLVAMLDGLAVRSPPTSAARSSPLSREEVHSDERIESLASRLGGLAVRSPPSDTGPSLERSRPSPPSRHELQPNPFFEMRGSEPVAEERVSPNTSSLEDLKSDILIEYLLNHPGEDPSISFDDLVRRNEVPPLY